jgi:glutathione S-transferase
MIIVHHLENSRSQRVLWLLEELGLPYEIKHYQRDAQTNLAPAALLKIHPLGKAPVITDNDLTIAESGAIIEYIIDTYAAHWRPDKGSAEYRRYQYWMHFAEGTAMPAFVMSLIFGKIKTAKMPFFAKPIARAIADNVLNSFVSPNIARQLSYINRELKDHTWFCGANISGADIQTCFVLEAAAVRASLNANEQPDAFRWLEAVRARPAYQKAIERGGPFNLLH